MSNFNTNFKNFMNKNLISLNKFKNLKYFENIKNFEADLKITYQLNLMKLIKIKTI